MRRAQGFSLLETLVAFTVLALSLGILMQIFSSSLHNAELTHDQAQATVLAQSLLAGAGIEAPLAAGENSGTLGEKFRWRLQVAPYEEGLHTGATESPRPVMPPLELWLVTVRVSWGDSKRPAERDVTLSTLRVQKPQQP